MMAEAEIPKIEAQPSQDNQPSISYTQQKPNEEGNIITSQNNVNVELNEVQDLTQQDNMMLQSVQKKHKTLLNHEINQSNTHQQEQSENNMRLDEKKNQNTVKKSSFNEQDNGNSQNSDKNVTQTKNGIRSVNLMEPLLNLQDSPKPGVPFFIKKTESVSEQPRPFKISFDNSTIRKGSSNVEQFNATNSLARKTLSEQQSSMSASGVAASQGNISSDSFDFRRSRYRYIKCWEDNRVQLVGIFQNMIESLSSQAIAMATSSSNSNYIVTKYFKDKVKSLLQFSSFSFTAIGTKGGDYFSKANLILAQIDAVNKRAMANSQQFAEFIESSIIKDLLQANAFKYESRLNRYKELTVSSMKKISKIGRGAAEQYQDYSNVFSELAAKDLRTTNKKKLLKVFQQNDLCLNEWNFLSRVFEHYQCLKLFGTETVRFVQELKELERERVDGLKQAVTLYITEHENLIAKIVYHQSTHPERLLDQSNVSSIRGSTMKHSSILSSKSSLSSSMLGSKRSSRRYDNPSAFIQHLYPCPPSGMNQSQTLGNSTHHAQQMSMQHAYQNGNTVLNSSNINVSISSNAQESNSNNNNNSDNPQIASQFGEQPNQTQNTQVESSPQRKPLNSRDTIELQDLTMSATHRSENNNTANNSSNPLEQKQEIPSLRFPIKKVGSSSSSDERKFPSPSEQANNILASTNNGKMNKSQSPTAFVPAPVSRDLLTSSSLLADLSACEAQQEVEPYFSLKNLIPSEEQNYLRKIYELEKETEVSLSYLCTFVEKFALRDLKMPGLIKREFKAQYARPHIAKKDVLLLLTVDNNLLVVESLASDFFKTPICFIKGYRSKAVSQGTSVIVTEIKNVIFRTKKVFTFFFDYSSDQQDFLAAINTH